MNVVFRKYRGSDWEAVVEMTREIVHLMSQLDLHKRFRSKDAFDAEKYVSLSMRKAEENAGGTFIVEVDGNVAGYGIAYVQPLEERDNINHFPAKPGYIDNFFVKEEFRGKAVAAELMKGLEDYFKSIGCAFSSVACVATNAAAGKFYEKMGYGEQYIDFLKKL